MAFLPQLWSELFWNAWHLPAFGLKCEHRRWDCWTNERSPVNALLAWPTCYQFSASSLVLVSNLVGQRREESSRNKLKEDVLPPGGVEWAVKWLDSLSTPQHQVYDSTCARLLFKSEAFHPTISLFICISLLVEVLYTERALLFHVLQTFTWHFGTMSASSPSVTTPGMEKVHPVFLLIDLFEF